MPTVIGLDSSTQSLSALLMDTEAGTILHEESVNFGKDLPQYGAPSGYIPGGKDGEVHADPRMWLEALDLLFTRLKEQGVDLSKVEAVSGSGQQHGSVYLRSCFPEKLSGLSADSDLKSQLEGCLTRSTSPIWMDGSTSEECAEIATAVGGNEVVCAKSGSIAIERFSGPQIRRFAKKDPTAWAETGSVHLVSSYLASVLAGAEAGIDFGDGAGMNLMNLADEAWDEDLVNATAEGLAEKLPALVSSDTLVGNVSVYFTEKYGLNADAIVTVWSGDNPCSLVGMGAATPGKVVISLGTSDTMFAAMPNAVTDPNGYGHVFGNPMGGYMSLICFMNGSLAREAVKEEYGLSWDDFETEALASEPAGNAGRLMLPFVKPEITPLRDSAGITFSGWEEGEKSHPAIVRALLEGQFTNMRIQSEWLGVQPEVVLLTGGASKNNGIAQIVANVFQVPVQRLAVSGSAALGAGIRAAVTVCWADLAELEAKFCRPEEGGEIKPEPQTAEAMIAMKKGFEALLGA